jgi:SNF2 family DNA or RNA helicase
MCQVYRLITRKTYEAVMFEKASMKLGLEQAVLGRARDKGPSKVRPFFST